ncbi:MAG: TonB-dependent receptor [Flavobacteriales bacterium]
MVEVIDSFNLPVEAGHSYVIDLDRETNLRLDELVRKNSAIHLKTTAPGLLSVPTYRGGDASHTAVLMNGVSLNSPMLGSIDFSTLPLGLFDRAVFFTGTSSNTVGLGGIGGGINLISQEHFLDTTAQIGLSIGSFGVYSTNVRVSHPFIIGRRFISLMLFANQGINENQFSFHNIYSTPEKAEVMKSAKVNSGNYGIVLGTANSNKTQFTFMSWLSIYSRQIPLPISSSLPSTELQNDTSIRNQLIVAFNPAPKLRLKSVSHFELNKNYYRNERFGILNLNSFTSIQEYLLASYELWKGAQLEVQENPIFIMASSGNYSNQRNELRNSAMAKLKSEMLSKLVVLEGGIRLETVGPLSIILPFAGGVWKISRKSPVSLSGSYSQTARFPSLNERYWNPGGNPQLKPEEGETIELGMAWKNDNADIKLTYFDSRYRNRIRWLPTGSIFSPVNIASSHSHGVEVHWSSSHRFNVIIIEPFANMAFTNSTGIIKDGGSRHSLSYSPANQGSVGVDLIKANLSLSTWCEYVSKRFITNDESAYMPAYALLSTRLAWKHKCGIETGLTVSNMFDTDYQNLPWRPMPGRSFQMSINYRI